jgi:acyl-[acyl-carrier-protein]-phospholipid O-acyltransferase/long-chain-fatty-acid--[acyl-carrier-protein] ligase
MGAAEALVASVWPEARHAVVAVPDARKGEALLLVTTQAGAEMGEILAQARALGVAELAVPRMVFEVAAIPLLGTGKIDYPEVQRMVEAREVGAAAA